MLSCQKPILLKKMTLLRQRKSQVYVPDCRVWQFPTRSRVCKSKILSVQFDLSVHFKCADKILNLYLKEILTQMVIIVLKNIPIQRLFCPVFQQKHFGPKFDCTQDATGIHRLTTMSPRSELSKQDCLH